jgi:hypothetical protein
MKKRRHSHHEPIYTLLDAMTASTTEPLADTQHTLRLEAMRLSLIELERGEHPERMHWMHLCDSANLLEALESMGVIEDEGNQIEAAVLALAEAARRARAGAPIRLSGPGMQAVRGMLEDFTELVAEIPARTMITAYRQVHRRVREIHQGKRRAGDVEVVTL